MIKWHFFLISVIARCGDTLTENNTYFESSGSETGSCRFTICKTGNNICQVFTFASVYVYLGRSISIIYFSWDWTLKLLSLLDPQPDLTLKPSTPRFSTVNHILRNQAILLDIWRFIAGDGVALTGGTDANYATRCLTDSFAVTAPGSSTANNPTLCGTNTGEHSNNN